MVKTISSIRTTLAVGGMAAAAALAAVGCGGGEGSASQTVTQATPAPASSQAPADLASNTNLARAGESARKTASQYDRTAAHYRRLSVRASLNSARLRLINALRAASTSYQVVAAAAEAGDVRAYGSALVAAGESRQLAQEALSHFRVRASAVRTTGGRAPRPRPQAPVNPCAGDSTSDDPSDDACDSPSEP